MSSNNIDISSEATLPPLKISGKITEVIEQIATRKIIEKEAELAGLTIEKDELQNAADKFRVANQLVHAKHTIEWLTRNRLSMKDFEETIRMNLLKSKLVRRLFIDDIKSYFYENQHSYRKAVLYEIIIDSSDLALELFYSVREGEITFSDAAMKYSNDINVKRKRGYLGIVNTSSLKASISSVVFSSSPPQLLKPIVTSLGAHLIFVDEIITPQLDDELGDEIAEELLKNWVKNKIREYGTVKSVVELWKE
jgi:parvulin-like peptidyl-prolyl isomerase